MRDKNKEQFKKLPNYLIILGVALIILYYAFLQPYIDRIRFFRNMSYTVATVDFKSTNPHTRQKLECKYAVDNKNYTTSRNLETFKLLKINHGDRVYVKFSNYDPSISVLLNCCKVGIDSSEVPAKGWNLTELQKTDPTFIDNYQPFWFFSTDDPDIYPVAIKASNN